MWTFTNGHLLNSSLEKIYLYCTYMSVFLYLYIASDICLLTGIRRDYWISVIEVTNVCKSVCGYYSVNLGLLPEQQVYLTL